MNVSPKTPAPSHMTHNAVAANAVFSESYKFTRSREFAPSPIFRASYTLFCQFSHSVPHSCRKTPGWVYHPSETRQRGRRPTTQVCRSGLVLVSRDVLLSSRSFAPPKKYSHAAFLDPEAARSQSCDPAPTTRSACGAAGFGREWLGRTNGE
jgi:hypothetical protein